MLAGRYRQVGKLPLRRSCTLSSRPHLPRQQITRQHPKQHNTNRAQRHQYGRHYGRKCTLHGKAQTDHVVDESEAIGVVDQLDTAPMAKSVKRAGLQPVSGLAYFLFFQLSGSSEV